MTRNKDLKISLIGVPTNSSGKSGGVAGGPSALRSAGLVDGLGLISHIRDEGDVSLPASTTARDKASGIIAYRPLASMIRGVRTSVARSLREGRFPLVIGGDCPVLLGCLAASAAAYPTGLVFVDGHEDAYPPHESPTGEAADMELGFVLGHKVPELIRKSMGSVPLLEHSKICIFGPRDKKALEKTRTRSLDDGTIMFYDDGSLRNMDMLQVAESALRKLNRRVDKLWLHVDLDVLSTRSLPAVDYRQQGGLNWGQLEALTASILSRGNVIGMDLTIYNPDLDPKRCAARRIVRFLQAVFAAAN
jgi:arginase